MRSMLVVELLAAGACTLGGMHFWSIDFRSRDSAVIPHTSGAGVPAADTRVPAQAGSRERASVAREQLETVSATVPEEGAGERASVTSGETPSREPSHAAVIAPEVRRQAHPKPRAPSSAIAAFPPLVGNGATAPRIPEGLARVALRFVGVDPAAEKTWVAAINQPSLSPDARSNLIEDLNEDGFPDPNNITAADLPLILERLRIIERLMSRAMDDTNAAAFQEAYKDLIDMLVRLGGAASR